MPNPEAELNQCRDYLLDQIRNRRPAVQSQLPVHLVPLLTERMADLAENFVLKVSKRMEE
jgi:hypothetical protein